MATKLEMAAAFGSLLETMSRRFEPFFEAPVVERWLAVTALSSNVAEPGLWAASASEAPGYAPMVTALNRVTNRLVAAVLLGEAAAIVAALDAIDAALVRLRALLEGAAGSDISPTRTPPGSEDFQRSANATPETPATGTDDPPAREADRSLDLALLADHYSPGDRVEPDARLPADAALAPDRDYTLEVAIRADRFGFGGARASLKPPRRQQEAITVYARVTARDNLRFEDRLLPLTWPFDTDSTPAFFRFRTSAVFAPGTAIEVRLLSGDLRLLDHLELFHNQGQWQVRFVDSPTGFARPDGLPARDALSLHVVPAGAGYALDALLTRNGNPPLELPLGQIILPADIVTLQAGVRNHWTELVIGPMSTRLEFSTAGSHQKATIALAAHGRLAWRLLFGDGRGSQAGTSEAFARLLIDDPLPPNSVIRITCDDAARGFAFPWTIVAPPAADRPQFWGLAYQIEIARKHGRNPPPPEALRITAVIDPGFAKFVDHPATLATVAASGGTATLAMPTSPRDVGAALAADNPSEIFYFFCHGIMGGAAAGIPADIAAIIAGAAAKLPDDARAPWDRLLERLAVTDGAGARMFFGTAELTEQALRDTDFFRDSRRPLVFLNMCHSAATAPASRAGLPAVFLDRDAVAVIGTEAPINAQFGDAFARELLTRLLVGEPLGAAMLATRRGFDERRNPLALVYTVYGRGDTVFTTPRVRQQESVG